MAVRGAAFGPVVMHKTTAPTQMLMMMEVKVLLALSEILATRLPWRVAVGGGWWYNRHEPKQWRVDGGGDGAFNTFLINDQAEPGE